MAITAPSVYFKFDNTLVDAVGGIITLTNNNGAVFGTGILNQAIDLEKSSSQFLSIDTALGASAADINFSFSCWINPESNPVGTGNDQFQQILSYTVATANSGWQYFMDYLIDSGSYRIRWLRGGSDVTANLGGTPLPTGSWTHLVGTYNGSQIKFYRNGVSLGTSPASGVGAVGSAPNYLRFGQYRDGNGGVLNRYFDGRIDESGLWFGHALSDAEVVELYGGGTPPSYPFPSPSQSAIFMGCNF